MLVAITNNNTERNNKLQQILKSQNLIYYKNVYIKKIETFINLKGDIFVSMAKCFGNFDYYCYSVCYCCWY